MDKYSKGVRDALGRAGLIRTPEPSWFAAFAVGAGFGLVAGACIAMLTAPRSGLEIRREVGSKAKRFAERTQEAIEGAAGTLKGRMARVEEDLHRGRNDIPAG